MSLNIQRILAPSWKLLVILALVILRAPLLRAEEEKPVVREKAFEKDGVVSVRGVCLLGTTGCQSKFFSTLAGNQRNDWWQDVHVKKDQPVDLAHACYRKRDDEKKGAGLCCEPALKDGKPDDQQIRNWFGVIAWQWK